MATREVAHGRWIELGGRLGLAAQGLIYVLVAIIAVQVAAGGEGQTQDPQGALTAVADEPLGWALLFALAAGFGGYALWAFAQAFFDRDREGADPIGLGKRIGRFGSGLLYAGLCVVAVTLLAGAGSGGGSGGEEKQATAAVLDLPLGRWIVGGVGAGFVIGGLWFAFKACTRKFREDLRTGLMRHVEARGYTALGVIGHLGRAVVFLLIGAFLIRAAWQYDPDEAVGVDGALRRLAGEPYGPYLLGATAVGLLAFGIFCFVEARYRDV